MTNTVQRYRFFVDPMVPCCCELEPFPTGGYVLNSDYERDIALERERAQLIIFMKHFVKIMEER